jgi:hypothetical protein
MRKIGMENNEKNYLQALKNQSNLIGRLQRKPNNNNATRKLKRERLMNFLKNDPSQVTNAEIKEILNRIVRTKKAKNERNKQKGIRKEISKEGCVIA